MFPTRSAVLEALAVAVPVWPRRCLVVLAAVLVLGLALPPAPIAASLSPLERGIPVEGVLTDEDPVLDDGTFFHLYALEGREGEQLRLRLSSPDVDAFLVLFSLLGDWLVSDDDSGGGTDALLEATLPEDGTYLVAVNTVWAGETGRYTLLWELGATDPAPPLDGEGDALTAAEDTSGLGVDGFLVPGQPVTGVVGAFPDHYRTYVVEVPPEADSLVVSLQAKVDLDLFVRFRHQMEDWTEDPDHAAVTPAGLEELVIDGAALRAGPYYIDVANLLSSSSGGPFVLLATLGVSGDEPRALVARPVEEQVAGTLDPGGGADGVMGAGDLVQFWAVDVPPGAQTLEVGLFDASGPLDLVAAPEGALPFDLEAFPHGAMTALANERLSLPVGAVQASRWWIGVVNWEHAPATYRLEVRVDEPLPPHPTVRPAVPPTASPLQRALSAAVQIASSLGLGSGTLVSPDGLILTNYHVVAHCAITEPAFACAGEPLRAADGSLERLVVGVADVEQGVAVQAYYAVLEQALPEYDLALLRIETDLNGCPPPGAFPWVPIDLAPVALGEEVLVIGYPTIARAGDRNPLSLTRGIVSGFTTHQGRRVLIQTDATINSGNSGGLMVRARDGVLIGVPSDVRYDAELFEKQDYARPVQLLPAAWVELIEAGGGRVLRGEAAP